jgi:GNAT superfamily N-acetyltransferase
MTPVERARFGPVEAVLKDGRSVVLRWLLAVDEARLGDFYESVPQEDYRFYRCQPLGRALAREVASAADGAENAYLLAEEPGGAIAGYAWFAWGAGSWAAADRSVFGVCLRRSHQRAGLGKALMARLLEAAWEVGPPVMTLTVQLANPRAVALYRKMGFQIVREQMRNQMRGFPAEPEYFMERKVR